MGFGELSFSMKMRDTIEKLVINTIERVRPKYRYAIVNSIDRVNRKCTVTFVGDPEPVIVNMGSVQPATAGQTVRIDGTTGDRFIDDVMGPAYSVVPPWSVNSLDFNTLVQRNESGQIAITAPISGSHGVNKDYADGLIPSDRDELLQRVRNRSTVPINDPGQLVATNSNGHVAWPEPTLSNHTATKGYVDALTPPAPVSVNGSTTNTITSASWANMPTRVRTTINFPVSTLVLVTYGASVGKDAADDVRMGVAVTGGGSSAASSPNWGQVVWATSGAAVANTMSAEKFVVCSGSTTFEMMAYCNVGSANLNYPVMEVIPIRVT